MDISANILEVAQEGAKKTKIMHLAFLSHSRLEEYLELLTHAGLIDVMKEKEKYYTTEKGRHFLKTYNDIGQSILPSASRHVVQGYPPGLKKEEVGLVH